MKKTKNVLRLDLSCGLAFFLQPVVFGAREELICILISILVEIYLVCILLQGRQPSDGKSEKPQARKGEVTDRTKCKKSDTNNVWHVKPQP